MAHVSYTGQVRRTAFALWRGAESAYTTKSDQAIGGLCILHLAIRYEVGPLLQIESRGLYGGLGDDETESLLRAVFWDKQSINLTNTPPIQIPARFIQIPASSARQWVERFDKVPTVIQTTRPKDERGTICTVRIDGGSMARVFEQTWQVLPTHYEALMGAWQEVWQQLGDALGQFPPIIGVDETFPEVHLPPNPYDWQGYQPTLTVP